MKMTTYAILAASTIAAFPANAQDRADWPDSLSISTGSQGGTYFVWGSGLGSMIGERLRLPTSVEITGGPVQNVVLVETGETLVGFSTTGPAQQSFGQNRFQNGRQRRRETRRGEVARPTPSRVVAEIPKSDFPSYPSVRGGKSRLCLSTRNRPNRGHIFP